MFLQILIMDPNLPKHKDEDFDAMAASMISDTSPHEQTTEVGPNQRRFVAGFGMDMQYIKSFTGLLKIVEIVLDIVVAICVGMVGLCATSCLAVQFLQFVSSFTLTLTTAIFVIYVFNLQQKIYILNWPLTDLIICVTFSVLYLIGSSFMVEKAITDSGKAASAFGFIAFAVYVISSWWAFTVCTVGCKKRQSPVSQNRVVEAK